MSSTVFIDVDTQIDFVFPAGALYVPGAEAVIPVVGRLNAYASARGHRLISTVDAHTENDVEFRTWPHHCVIGTVGQQKPASTLVSGQTMFPKLTTNAFATGEMDVLLDSIGAQHYVVYGVVTEICVDAVVRGLLRRGHTNIDLVTDAVRHLQPDQAEALFRELSAAGGRLITSPQFT
jgi:nicotinamidase/pyrazinamidase